jgi:FYVE/RhoGEF/PH domain-containing protein 5/6
VQIEFGDMCTLVAPHRVFIRRGALSKQCRRRRKEYEFVLFNDLLVYGSISASLDSDTNTADQGDAWSWSKLGVASKKLHRLLPIDASFACSEAALPDPDAEVEGNGETEYPFSIYSSTKSFLVFAPSAAQRAAWIADLRHCADEMQKRYRSNASDAARAAVVSARPVWASDDSATQCTLCAKEFSFFVRRHHCRRCGRLCCDDCSGARLPIDANPAPDAPLERQCDPCAEETRRNMSGSSELDLARVVAAAFEATAAVDSDASDNE